MPLIEDFFRNRVLFAAGLAWLLAQVFKVLITLIISKKFTPERLWGAGGMPSAHSAMVCALTVSIARFNARLLNKYLNQIENQKADVNGDGIPDKEVDEIELKEFIGHTPLEVLGGVLLGILVGILIPA